MLHRSDKRCHVRCRRCKARRVLPRHPGAYTREMPVCRSPGCGGKAYTADKWMNERNTSTRGEGAQGCLCSGYPWQGSGGPHRRGSLFCWYRKDGSDRLPGDADFRDRNQE